MRSRTTRPALTAIALIVGLGACAEGGPSGEEGLSSNPEAMAAFEAANDLWAKAGRTRAEADESIALLEEAIRIDPTFAMAHAYVAESDAWIHQNWDRSTERAERALEAAERAVSLAPDLAAAHAALGAYYYRIAKEYEPALEHYTTAQELDPESASALRMTGYVARRAGRWDRAVELLTEAEGLTVTRASAWDLGNTYLRMGRYEDARAAYEKAREIDPEHWQPPHALVWLDIHERGDLSGLRAYLDDMEGGFIGNRHWLAMVDGEWEAALAALEAPGADVLSGQYGITPRSLMAGLAYRRMGDEARAMEAFREARATMEELVAETPDDPRTHLALGLALAALGLRDEAVEAGRTGVALMPPERDAMIGPNSVWWMAEIYATAGASDLALEELERLMSLRHGAGNATIALDPWLYRVADDPRFQELLGTD